MGGWQIWAVGCVVLAVDAEALNVLVPGTIVLQWVLFAAALACFMVAITTWDRRRRSRPRRPRNRTGSG